MIVVSTVVKMIVAAMILWPVLLSSTLLASEIAPPPSPTIETTKVTSYVVKTSNTENYLPRKLYPGTYKNFCGPTPEVTVKDGCKAHGWHGDDAGDEVDAACQLHDISYCSCESQLMQRKALAEPMQGLASMIALRFVTLPTLQKFGTVDQDYLKCIHRADSDLIASGIRIRRLNQQSNCQANPALGWFCQQDGGGTLAAFEQVNLSIFLKNLDADESKRSPRLQSSSTTLSQLERKRHADLLKEVKSGKGFASASSSKAVQKDDEDMLVFLEQTKEY